MRRSLTLSAILLMGASLSGCAQLTSVGDWISKPFRSELREAPKPDWEASTAATTTTNTSTRYSSAPTGYSTTSYSAPSTISTGRYYGVDDAMTFEQVAVAPPESLSYVRLNGESRMSDWENCERLHNGYWRIDAAGGRIDPGFEVCMRNKGYVRESELAMYGFGSSNRVAGRSSSTLTGGYGATTYSSSGYSTGTYSSSYGAYN